MTHEAIADRGRHLLLGASCALPDLRSGHSRITHGRLRRRLERTARHRLADLRVVRRDRTVQREYRKRHACRHCVGRIGPYCNYGRAECIFGVLDYDERLLAPILLTQLTSMRTLRG